MKSEMAGDRGGVEVIVGEILLRDAPTVPSGRGAGPAKVYVEPTTRCNLACRFCARRAREEPLGDMTEETFSAVLSGVRALSRRPTLFFGGLGEPLAHPRLPDMVAAGKAAGARIELVTNGTLLSRELGRELAEAGLDLLWVSLDGVAPDRYGDPRPGHALQDVVENVRRLQTLPCTRLPEIGVAFVAKRSNVRELPSLLRLSRDVGATRFHVSHLWVHTQEMLAEALYSQTLVPEPPRRHARCPFVAADAVAVAWDGSVAPCLPLLRSSTSFLNGAERVARRWSLGNVRERSLADLWEDPEMRAFRERVKAFRFSPCASCGSCSIAYTNEDDCFGNPFPTCGGCLWAHGLIACP